MQSNMADIFDNLERLSFQDRVLFNRFGRGPAKQSPFSFAHKAFESHVSTHPHSIAVEHEDNIFTYQEVENLANTLANELIRKGLQPRQRVCLVIQRSIYMIIAILAVLKCGCQYIPLDGGVVADHNLINILNDTQAPFVLCLQKFRHRVQQLDRSRRTVIVLDILCEKSGPSSDVRPDVDIDPTDGAYLIYTSGSTGKPKGVDVTHRNVTNLLCLAPGSLNITKGTKVAQLLSVSFDMGQWEILGTLMNGGTLLLRTSDWRSVLKRAHTIIATPSILSTFKREEYPNIQTVALAGEPCPQSLADDWAKQVTFYNCCGPTEVTIVNTMQLHKPGEHLSIGKPIPNTNVYVLDENENPVNIGATGMMWAGGYCVSRGYVNLSELTSAKFKLDKFVNDGSLMFNTGDLGRWLENGTLEHQGRIDDQVKIKGFRVELDGVSAAIESVPGVDRSYSIFRDNVLWGFYSGDSQIDESILAEEVAKRQPYYAVPSKWVFQPVLPFTPNGKIDKNALVTSISTTPEDCSLKKPLTAVLFPSAGRLPASYADSSASVDSNIKEDPKPISSSSDALEKYELPGKNGRHGIRALRHRFFSLYRRFFSIVFISNLIALCIILSPPRANILADLATATSSNLAFAVLIRQDHVINFLFTIACCVPSSAPLFIRRNLAKVYHIGGLHSGCAVASLIWFLLFTIIATVKMIDSAVLGVSYLIIILLIAIVVTAYPTFRSRFHNRFELIHRLAGWTSLALFWILVTLFVNSSRGTASLRHAMAQTASTWLLVVTTVSIVLPWLNLRKVNVRSEVLSEHAVRMHFTYTTPTVGTAVRLSEKPLVEWHAFATVAKPNEKGFSLIISNAGDWTSRQIRNAPTKLWVKGVPACGVLRIVPLFRRIVLVATGSGIGPCLPVIYAKRVPARIFWSTPNPEKTFGHEIIQAVLDSDPHAVIHNTKTQGRPDMVAVTYALFRESGAEAVCVISNPKLTRKVVYAMESRGIPAFGPIWDS